MARRVSDTVFLCIVSKRKGLVSIYHLFPRFEVWSSGKIPATLELQPSFMTVGQSVQWHHESIFSLSAPIIQVDLHDLIDNDRIKKAP
jgi:hypothetical protein